MSLKHKGAVVDSNSKFFKLFISKLFDCSFFLFLDSLINS